MSESKPAFLNFRVDAADGSVATAKAELLWNKAPKTCAAIVDALPIETYCWHGRNSGSEALLVTPSLISHLPQDATENGTTEHKLGNVLFGYEPAGFCHGGAGSEDASEIAWIYGEAAQACYWVSEKGPPHDVGPYHRQAATLNVFAQMVEEDGFYACSQRLIKTGQQRIRVWAS